PRASACSAFRCLTGCSQRSPRQIPAWPVRCPRPGGDYTGMTTPSGGFGDDLKRDRRKALRWPLVLVVAALLPAGGTIEGLPLAGRSSSGTPGEASAADAQQGALLNSALSNAGSPGTLVTALGATAMSGADTQNGPQPGAANGPACAGARKVARVAG